MASVKGGLQGMFGFYIKEEIKNKKRPGNEDGRISKTRVMIVFLNAV